VATVERGVLAGLVGTSAMTVGYAVEHRIRRSVDGPLDYDDSDAPAVAAARVLCALHVLRGQPGEETSKALGLLVHWGYGSAMGLAAVPLLHRARPVAATLAFTGGISVMAGALFPLLGGTPPPWRWKRDVVVTSLVQHLLYAAVVVAVAGQEHLGQPG
jgi:hypothetical protein